MSGWECPKCHRCYAPTVWECKACNDAALTTAPSYPCPTWPNPDSTGYPSVRPYPWDHWTCMPSGTLTVTDGTGVVVPYSRQ